MNRNEKRAYEIIKLGKELAAEKQRKTAIIKRTAYSVFGICAAVSIGFGIWNNDAIKNSADFDNHNSSIIAENTAEPEESGASAVSAASTSENTVNSTETSKITTAETAHTQGGTVSVATTKKTAPPTTEAVTRTQTATKTEPMSIVTNTITEPMSGVTAKPTSGITNTNSAPTSGTTTTISEPLFVTSSDTSITTTTVSDTATTTSEQFTSVATTTDGNSTTTPVPEIIKNDEGVFIGISYDGVIYYKVTEQVDTSYIDRDKRLYLGYIYHNGQNYGDLFYVYDYKEQGKPALILCELNSNIYRLFLA